MATRLIDVEDLKLAIPIDDTQDDALLGAICDATTDTLQAYCGRQFLTDASPTARWFCPLTPTLCLIEDSSDASITLKTDDNEDGTAETTWASTDYQLEPLNSRRMGQEWPYTQIRAIDARTFPSGPQALVEVTATWGWPSGVPDAVAEAARIQAISIWKSLDAPLGIAGFGDIGIMRLRQALHPVAQMLIAEYRLDPVLVA